MSARKWLTSCTSALLLTVFLQLPKADAQTVVTSSVANAESIIRSHDATCVFFFLGECPVSMRDFSVVRRIHAQWDTARVAFLAVYVEKEMHDFNHIVDSIAMPIYFMADANRTLAKQAGLQVAPEYFVLDRNGRLHYRGAIDNYAIAIGRHRTKATKHYLMDAINAVLGRKPLSIRYTRPYGCYLEPLD